MVPNTRPSKTLEAGPWRIDPHRACLTFEGEEVDLRGKPLRLLHVLMARAGTVVTKEELLQAVWDGRPLSDAVLTTTVRSVRQVLGDDARAPTWIETVHGTGYRFLQPVRGIPDSDEARERDDAARPAVRGRPGMRLLGAAGVATVLLTLLAWVLHAREMGSEGTSAMRAVAVLPFADLSPSGDHRWFADGLVEEVLDSLARSDTLHVAARTSSFRFRYADRDLREIGRALDVTHVIEGSVRLAGTDRLRVTAQLVRTEDGFHAWSRSWDRRLDPNDALAVQQDLSARIVAQVGADVPARTTTPAGGVPLAAWEAYQRGRALAERRTAGALREGIGLLERAVEAAPDHAPARAELANAILLGMAQGVGEPGASFARAEREIERALHSAPESPQALTAAAFLEIARRDLDAAQARAAAAVAADPDHVPALQRLGGIRLMMGDADGAYAVLQRARALDPLSGIVLANLSMAALRTGRVEEALAIARRNARWNPGEAPALARLGALQLWLGRYEAAFRNLSAALALTPDQALLQWHLSELLWRLGADATALGVATEPWPRRLVEAALALEAGDVGAARAFVDAPGAMPHLGLDAVDVLHWAGRSASLIMLVDAHARHTRAPHAGGAEPLPLDPVSFQMALEAGEDLRAPRLAERIDAYVASLAPEGALLQHEIYAAAAWSAHRGREAEALRWLGRAAERGFVLRELRLDPAFDGVRALPEFEAVLARMDARAAKIAARLELVSALAAG